MTLFHHLEGSKAAIFTSQKKWLSACDWKNIQWMYGPRTISAHSMTLQCNTLTNLQSVKGSVQPHIFGYVWNPKN
jgi:hypothetical protein